MTEITMQKWREIIFKALELDDKAKLRLSKKAYKIYENTLWNFTWSIYPGTKIISDKDFKKLFPEQEPLLKKFSIELGV